jgi:hypothetical protein
MPSRRKERSVSHELALLKDLAMIRRAASLKAMIARNRPLRMLPLISRPVPRASPRKMPAMAPTRDTATD